VGLFSPEIPRCTRTGKKRPLVEKYRELKCVLAGLAGQTFAQLVDALLPADNDECSVLREVATLAIPQLESVGDLFDRIKTHITQPEMPEAGEYVRVMSLHKSKGLTSKVAIVAGCTEGLIPFRDDEQTHAEQDAILRPACKIRVRTCHSLTPE